MERLNVGRGILTLIKQDIDCRYKNSRGGLIGIRPVRLLRGFTLLEIMMTLVIMAIGLLGVMKLQSNLVDGAVDNSQRSIGLYVANTLINKLRINSEADYRALLDNNALRQCNAPPPNSCNNTDCNKDQLALSDVWGLYCSDAIRHIKIEDIELTCLSLPLCQRGDNISVSVSWTLTNLEDQNASLTVSTVL